MNPYRLPADQPWCSRILFRTEVGSTAHGTGIDGHEDYDEIAVMWEPLSSLVGLNQIKDTIIYRPGRAPDQRSGPGDWDLTVYTARKWARLAAAGNPSILVSLFGPRIQTTESGLALLDNPQWFWADHARDRFLGYARAQRERLLGIRGGRHANRPELEAMHGYDTKYAMHMLRLGYQGIEYLLTGRIVLPMLDDRGDHLRAVRRGETPLGEVLTAAESLESQLRRLNTDAPPLPDYDAIDRWLLSLEG
jgi:uncharacterized protein